MGLDAFAAWLRRRVRRWSEQPVFRQRVRIRQLRCSFPGLLEAETEWRRALKRDLAGALHGRLQQLEESLRGVDKAVKGLAVAGRPEKLAAFRDRQRQLRDELAALVAVCPERQEREHARERWEAIRRASGLDKEEEALRGLLRESGRGSGSRGKAFERAAYDFARKKLAPRLGVTDIFKGMTFKGPDTELDMLLARADGTHAVVLAVIEAKRNANDLAHGYRQRRRNLRWLSGDAKAQATTYYRSGFFDRPYLHEGLVFDSSSFRNTSLFFLTRPGWIWGMSSQTFSRLSHRVATDVRFCWDPEYIESLRAWTVGLTGSLETPDLLLRDDLRLALLRP